MWDCRYIKPQLPEIESRFPEFQFVEVDRDVYMDVAVEWNIFGIPSLVVIEDGKRTWSFSQQRSKNKSRNRIFLIKSKLNFRGEKHEWQRYQNILVGVDGSDQANEAFKKAVEVARRNQGKVYANIIDQQIPTMMGYAPLDTTIIEQEKRILPKN